VAKMAGMPPTLINRANEILKQLEDKNVTDETDESLQTQQYSGPVSEKLNNKINRLNVPQVQLSIFDAHSEVFDEIRNLLNAIDINRLTPVEALLKLNEIKGKLK